MNATNSALALIIHFTGFHPRAYKPYPDDPWTIGFNHMGGVKKNDFVSKEQAFRLLKEDVKKIEPHVLQLLAKSPEVFLGNFKIDRQYQFDALVSFAYDCGCPALKSSGLAKAMKNGETEGRIRAEFERWVYNGKMLLPSLVRRRIAEADLYFGERHFLLGPGYEAELL